jgi:putative endonuclease
MFIVYAIKSIGYNFIYIGMTEDLNERLRRHNKRYVRSTRKFAPFDLIYTENCLNGQQAREREKFLISTSGKRFLKAIIFKKQTDGIGR